MGGQHGCQHGGQQLSAVLKQGLFSRPINEWGAGQAELILQLLKSDPAQKLNNRHNDDTDACSQAISWAPERQITTGDDHDVCYQPHMMFAGKYDEDGLKALDYVIASASKHGIKLILSFIDNWKYYNGVDQFVDWCITDRKMPPPKESGGDTDTEVRVSLCVCSSQTQAGSSC